MITDDDINQLVAVFFSIFLSLALLTGIAWFIWYRVEKSKRRKRRGDQLTEQVEGTQAAVEG
jgi:hypothetical protein